MSEFKLNEAMIENRKLIKSTFGLPSPLSGKEAGVPQMPRTKAPISADSIALSKNFEAVLQHKEYDYLVHHRRSKRAFLNKGLSLEQLSYLLWSTQGIQKVIGKNNKATLRPVASGGASHAFETYIAVRMVKGLEQGLYHYLPLEHRLEKVKDLPDYADDVTVALCGQSWAALAPIVLFWSCLPERSEWKYTVEAAKLMAIDIGHVGQQAYLSAEALGLGSCGVAAYDQDASDALLELDGEEEFAIYMQVVGVPNQWL